MTVHRLDGTLLPFRSRPALELASDDALLAAVAFGDTAPLCELFLRYGDRIYRVLAHTPELAEGDLEQAVLLAFLQIYRRAPRFSGRTKVSSWMMATSLRTIRRSVPSTRPRQATMPASRGAERIRHLAVPSGLESIDVARLTNMIAALPRSSRLIVALADGEGVRGTEVASTLGRSERSIWRRLDSARRLLRSELIGAHDRPQPNRLQRFLRTARWCPAPWKISRAVSNELDPPLGWHLSGCTDCDLEYTSLLSLKARLTVLSRPTMSDTCRSHIAAHLFAANLRK
jgi:DNA-directed RNA polymerase specialized sigma24 family protein